MADQEALTDSTSAPRSSPNDPQQSQTDTSQRRELSETQAKKAPPLPVPARPQTGISISARQRVRFDQAPGANTPLSNFISGGLHFAEVGQLGAAAKLVAAKSHLPHGRDAKDNPPDPRKALTPKSSRDLAGIRAIYQQVRHLKQTRPIVLPKFYNTVKAIQLATRHINMERSIATYLAEAAAETKHTREREGAGPRKVEKRGLSVFDAQVQRLALHRGDFLETRSKRKQQQHVSPPRCRGAKVLAQLVQELAESEDLPETPHRQADKQQAIADADSVAQLRSKAAEMLVDIKAIPPNWHGRLAEHYKSAEAVVRNAQVLSIEFEGAVQDLTETLQTLVGSEFLPFCPNFHSMQLKQLPEDTEICDGCNVFVSTETNPEHRHAWLCELCPAPYFLCQDCGEDRMLSLATQALREMLPADGWHAAIKRAQGCLKFGSGIPKGVEVYAPTAEDLLLEQAGSRRRKSTREKGRSRVSRASIASRKYSIASASSHSDMFVFLQGRTIRRMSVEGLSKEEAQSQSDPGSPNSTTYASRQSVHKVCRGRPSVEPRGRASVVSVGLAPVESEYLDLEITPNRRRASTSLDDSTSATDEPSTTAGNSLELGETGDTHFPKHWHLVEEAISHRRPASPPCRPQRRIKPPRPSVVHVPPKRQVHVPQSRKEQVVERYKLAVADGERIARRLMPSLLAEASAKAVNETDECGEDGKKVKELQFSPAACLEAWAMARMLLADDFGTGCASTPEKAKVAFGTAGDIDMQIWRATVASWGTKLSKYIDKSTTHPESQCSTPAFLTDTEVSNREGNVALAEQYQVESSDKMGEEDTLSCSDESSATDARLSYVTSEVGMATNEVQIGKPTMSSLDGYADVRALLDLDRSLTPSAMQSSALPREENTSREGLTRARPKSCTAMSRLRDLPQSSPSSRLSKTWAPASPIDRMPTPCGRRPRTGDYWSEHRRDHIKDLFLGIGESSKKHRDKDRELQDFKVFEVGSLNSFGPQPTIRKPRSADGGGGGSKRRRQGNIAEAIAQAPCSVKQWLDDLNNTVEIPDLPWCESAVDEFVIDSDTAVRYVPQDS